MALSLQGVRVLELTDGFGDAAGRFLADLGAEVVRVELPGGSAGRSAQPVRNGVSVPFALRNANKLGVVLDLDDEQDRDRLRALARRSDILLDSFAPGFGGGLEHPLYTRPPEFEGERVPDVLMSGDHGAIARWRADEAERRTRMLRPDLLSRS